MFVGQVGQVRSADANRTNQGSHFYPTRQKALPLFLKHGVKKTPRPSSDKSRKTAKAITDNPALYRVGETKAEFMLLPSETKAATAVICLTFFSGNKSKHRSGN